MAFSAGTAVVHVVADSSALASSISGGVNNAVSKLGSSLQRTGLSMTKFITAPLVGIGAVATHMALDFEQSFAKIGALAGDIGVPLKVAEEQVKKLAHATGQDPGGLADALYFVASAGVNAKEVMPILGASAKAAATGMGDASTIAQLLTTVLHDYEGTGLDAAKAMNILTGAIKVGKAEPADLAANIGVVIPVASQMGISFQDVAAALAQSTNAGNDAARSVTGLRFLIAAMQNPTDKAKEVFEDYGISIAKMQAELARPGGLLTVMQGFADTLDLTTVKGKAAWATITGGARGAVIANTLVGNSAESAREVWEALGESASNTSTLFEDAFKKKMTSTDAFKFQRLLANLKTAMMNLGEAIIPVLVEDVIPAVQKVVRWFKNLDDKTRSTVVKVGLLAAAFGPLLVVLGSVIRLGAGAVGVIAKLGRAAGLLPGAGTGGGAAAGGVGAGFLSWAAGIGAFAVAAKQGKDQLDRLQEGDFEGFVNGVANAFETWFPMITGIRMDLGRMGTTVNASEDAIKGWAQQVALGKTTTDELAAALRRQGASAEDIAAIIERVKAAQAGAVVTTMAWVNTLVRSGDVTKKQARFLQDAVDGIHRMGGSLKENERFMIANLLKVGDFNGALALLDRAADRAAAPLRNMQSAHQKAAGAAADQAQKVKALNTKIEELPKNTHLKIDTQVDTSGLDGLRSSLFGSGFTMVGGQWVASGTLKMKVTGRSPMPVEQFRIQIEDPLKRLGFTQKGREWVVDLYARFHLAAKEGEGDAVSGIVRTMNRIQKVVDRLSTAVADAITEAKAKLDEAIEKKVGEGAARMALETARAAQDVVKSYQYMVNVAQKQLDRLVQKFRDFKSDIRAGFDELKNFAGVIGDLFGQTDDNGNPIAVTAADISGAIQTQVQQAQQLAKLLTEAAAAGLSKGLVAQFASQGAGAIPALTELLANPALIEELNAASAAIAAAAGQTADTLGERFFGKAIKHATARIENLSEAIVKAIARIQSALGEISAGTAAALAAIQGAAQQGAGGGGGGGGGGTNWNTGWGGGGMGNVPPAPPWQPTWHPTWEPTWKPPKDRITVNVAGSVVTENQLVRAVDEGLAKARRRDGALALDK